MARATIIGGIRGSRPKNGKGYTTKPKRKREEVQIKYVNAEGRAVTADNVVGFARSMIAEGTQETWTEMARRTKLSPATISRLYYGDTHSPKLETTVRIMGLYGYKMRVTRDS